MERNTLHYFRGVYLSLSLISSIGCFGLRIKSWKLLDWLSIITAVDVSCGTVIRFEVDINLTRSKSHKKRRTEVRLLR